MYERLFVAEIDMGLARQYARYLLKKAGTLRLGSVEAGMYRYVAPFLSKLLAPPYLHGLTDMEYKAWPLAVPLGINRLGYLQHDRHPWRLLLPTRPDFHQAELIPQDGFLEIMVNEQIVADFCYWTARWGLRA